MSVEELEYQLLRRVWFPVAVRSDLRDGVLAAQLLDVELVVYESGGSVTVAQGRCPHRGMALSMGTMRDGSLECPYHGWLFAPDSGRCVGIPALPQGPVPGGVGLRTYPVREAYGHVWTCLDEPYLPFPEIRGFGAAGWEYAYGRPHDLGCGMRQLTENFRDVAHFPFVHAATMGPNVRREVPRYDVERDGWRLSWTLGADLGGTALDGNSSVATAQQLTYHLAMPMVAYVYTEFPAGGGRLTGQFATPISRSGDRVRQFWLVGVDNRVTGDYGVSLDEMWEYERRLFEEDYPIVENQWPAEAPLDVHSQSHIAADKYSLVFRRAYTELLNQFGASTGRG